MRARTVLFCIILLALVVGACQPVVSPQTATLVPHPTATEVPLSTATPERLDQILFFGNSLTSYNFGVHAHIKELAASANPSRTIKTSMIAGSNYSLPDHLGLNDDAIHEGAWDVVVLQGFPQKLEFERFDESVREFNEQIEQVGAQTVLYMTWERGDENPAITIDEIAQSHREIAAELGIKVAPVGLAWERSMQERPALDLYETDRGHPNSRGTYLAVCVLYATIFGQNPSGIDYQPADLIAGIETMEWKWDKWQMTEDEVAFLQRIAWETVVDYQK